MNDKINKVIEFPLKNGLENKSKEFETCVLCGKLTSVRKDTPLDLRSDYLEGAGQLCYECPRELYNKK